MAWDFSKPVKIFPTESANQRTKNRIREHSLVPRSLPKGVPIPASKYLKDCTLFSCRDCEWAGWLPNGQFKVGN